MNVAMVGYGMMGVWHSQALLGTSAVLHTAVGRRPEATQAFAERFGYRRVAASLDEMLADPAVDAVIVATPSTEHEAQAIRCLEAGKHVLLEIPIAMDLAGAERVAAAAEASGRTLALSHPMRFRREREALRQRLRGGEERAVQIVGRFFIHRLTNVGATGYVRSWTDNILWHHFCHFVDLGLDLLGDVAVRRVQSHYGPLHPVTGTPMDAVVLVETEAEQTLLVHGTYQAAFRLYDSLIVTDRDSYFEDILAGTLRTRDETVPIEDEAANCARVAHDFVAAVTDGRPPRATAASVLPAMRVLQAVQDDWDARFGARSIPGRPVAAAR